MVKIIKVLLEAMLFSIVLLLTLSIFAYIFVTLL